MPDLTPPEPTRLTLVYDGLLSQIQGICAAQMKRGPDNDRAIIESIRDIAATRLTEAMKQNNQLADQAHDLDEQRAATLALGRMLMLIKTNIEDGSFNPANTSVAIDELLTRDMVSEVLEEQDATRDRLTHLELLVNSPEIISFVQGAVSEAAHQKDRWGARHDEVKTMGDWCAVFTHLLGKFVKASWDRDIDKTLHHLITVAAVAANAHAQLVKLKSDQPPS